MLSYFQLKLKTQELIVILSVVITRDPANIAGNRQGDLYAAPEGKTLKTPAVDVMAILEDCMFMNV